MENYFEHDPDSIKTFSLDRLKEICEPNSIGWNDSTRQYIRDRLNNHRPKIDSFEYPFDFQYFTLDGLKQICNTNKLPGNHWSKESVEHAMRSHPHVLTMGNIFNCPSNHRYFTIDGLKVFCNLNNIDDTNCTTRKDYKDILLS